MNPQTWKKDIASIEPGGYLFYDSTKPLPPEGVRDDITVLGVPLTEICNRAYTDARQRQLFKNIIYVGALTALLGVDPEVCDQLVAEQFPGKTRLIKPNLEALAMGREAALASLPGIGLQVRRAEAVGDRIYAEGDGAADPGARAGGEAGWARGPVTPSKA